MKILTKPQRQACHNLYLRTVRSIPPPSYLKFRRQAQYDGLCDCLMVPVFGMVCGIELDGYTHS